MVDNQLKIMGDQGYMDVEAGLMEGLRVNVDNELPGRENSFFQKPEKVPDQIPLKKSVLNDQQTKRLHDRSVSHEMNLNEISLHEINLKEKKRSTLMNLKVHKEEKLNFFSSRNRDITFPLLFHFKLVSFIVILVSLLCIVQRMEKQQIEEYERQQSLLPQELRDNDGFFSYSPVLSGFFNFLEVGSTKWLSKFQNGTPKKKVPYVSSRTLVVRYVVFRILRLGSLVTTFTNTKRSSSYGDLQQGLNPAGRDDGIIEWLNGFLEWLNGFREWLKSFDEPSSSFVEPSPLSFVEPKPLFGPFAWLTFNPYLDKYGNLEPKFLYSFLNDELQFDSSDLHSESFLCHYKSSDDLPFWQTSPGISLTFDSYLTKKGKKLIPYIDRRSETEDEKERRYMIYKTSSLAWRKCDIRVDDLYYRLWVVSSSISLARQNSEYLEWKGILICDFEKKRSQALSLPRQLFSVRTLNTAISSIVFPWITDKVSFFFVKKKRPGTVIQRQVFSESPFVFRRPRRKDLQESNSKNERGNSNILFALETTVIIFFYLSSVLIKSRVYKQGEEDSKVIFNQGQKKLCIQNETYLNLLNKEMFGLMKELSNRKRLIAKGILVRQTDIVRQNQRKMIQTNLPQNNSVVAHFPQNNSVVAHPSKSLTTQEMWQNSGGQIPPSPQFGFSLVVLAAFIFLSYVLASEKDKKYILALLFSVPVVVISILMLIRSPNTQGQDTQGQGEYSENEDLEDQDLEDEDLEDQEQDHILQELGLTDPKKS